MSIELVAVIFIAGMLFDHFLLNKVAGLISPEVAKLQADVAGIIGKASATATTVTHVLVPATPAVPIPPVAPAAPVAPVAPAPAA